MTALGTTPKLLSNSTRAICTAVVSGWLYSGLSTFSGFGSSSVNIKPRLIHVHSNPLTTTTKPSATRCHLPNSDHSAPKLVYMLSTCSKVSSKTEYWRRSQPMLAYCAPCPVKTNDRPTSAELRVGLIGGRLLVSAPFVMMAKALHSIRLRRTARVKASLSSWGKLPDTLSL